MRTKTLPKKTASLSILLVEDDSRDRKILEKAFSESLSNYDVRFYYASSESELRRRLGDDVSYDLAIVDFDLSERDQWKSDALTSARLIAESNPSCLRIGVSIVADYAQSDRLMNEIYPIILDKRRLSQRVIIKRLEEQGL